jgi:hypothetical protein
VVNGKNLQSFACRTIKQILRYEVHPFDTFWENNLAVQRKKIATSVKANSRDKKRI